MISAHQVSF